MSERNNVLILLAVIVAIGFFAQAMQIFQGTDTTTVTVSLNNTGNLDTPVQSITYSSQSRVDIQSMLDTHIVSGYSDPRYPFNGYYYASKASASLDPAAVALTNHQVNAVLDHSNFPGMSSDFSGMRFGTPGGTDIPYWEGTVIPDTEADAWLKVPSISNSETTQILMYYGNSSAGSGSSISNTFIFNDTFESGIGSWTIDSGVVFDQSTTQAKHGTYSGRRHSDNGGGQGVYRSFDQTYTSDIVVDFSVYIDTVSTAAIVIEHTIGSFTNGYDLRFDSDGYIKYNDGSINNLQTYSADTWYDLSISSDLLADTFDITIDGTTYSDLGSRGIVSQIAGIELMGWGAGSDYYIDSIRLRQHTTTEPTWTAGGWTTESTTTQITPAEITLNSITNSTGTYGSYPIIPANTAQDFTLNGTQNFNYSIDFTPTDLTVTTSSSVLYADRAHTFNAIVSDHNTGIAMPTQPDKVKYRLVGSGNTSVSAKEFVGTSLTLPALQKGTYTLFTSVGWNNIPTWSNEISQSVILTDAATPAQAVALSVVEALTDTTTDTTSNETTKDVLVGAPGRIADGWKTMFDTIVTIFKNIIHNVSAVFS